jgi:glucosamine--fructose-6-phosphate aminotransferase (isomerizing)
MCGIVGYSGNKRAAPIIFESLKKVEYRGYDSAGIATTDKNELIVKKGIGKLDNVESKYKLSSASGKSGIGHTRWATHGGVTKANSHPHTDCKNNIAVVHNGTINNYQELRQELISRGHVFISQTDTEVIPHLIEEALDRGLPLEKAVLDTATKLIGAFTFLVLTNHRPGCIIGFKKDTPLIIGLDKTNVHFSSDILALPAEVNQTFTLNDNEMAVFDRGKLIFFNIEGEKINKQAKGHSGATGQVDKTGYPFYMLKEIMEQPQTIKNTLAQNRDVFNEIALDILRANQVIITACGTSRYAALVGRYLFSRIGKKFCDVIMSSEFQYFADSINKETIVIAVSQSGETADVIEGVKNARQAGAKIISLVNRPMSLLGDLSHYVIHLNCGPEIGVAATKSYTSQLIVFYLLAFSMVNCFDISVNMLKNIRSTIAKTIRSNNNKLIRLCNKLKDKKDFYYIARGINFAIASEGALKLKEISYIHAEGMPAGELKHGTLALIEKDTPVVVICPDDYTYTETLNNAIEAKSRGAYIIAVSDRENEIYDAWIKIPKVDEILYPLVTVIPLQLIAYHMAIALELDPDKPRNLAKSVTVK